MTGAERVRAALAGLGLGHEVVTLPRPARTSAEAAAQVGCHVDQIAKSLVFRGRHSGRPLLVIARGGGRVDEARLATLVGEPVERADADFVRARTGFAIGGVPPLAHAEPLVTIIDDELMGWDEVWAAAGHPHTVFRLRSADLVTMTGGRVAAVRGAPPAAGGTASPAPIR